MHTCLTGVRRKPSAAKSRTEALPLLDTPPPKEHLPTVLGTAEPSGRHPGPRMTRGPCHIREGAGVPGGPGRQASERLMPAPRQRESGATGCRPPSRTAEARLCPDCASLPRFLPHPTLSGGQDETCAHRTTHFQRNLARQYASRTALHLAVSVTKLGIFLHITRIQSYFLRSERNATRHIVQIVGLLDFLTVLRYIKRKTPIPAHE